METQKDGYSDLRLSLQDTDKEKLRHMAKRHKHPGGMSGLAVELIEQGLGKRKLGDYIHVDSHKSALTGKQRQIDSLKKKISETAVTWEGVVLALGMTDNLRKSVKNIANWALERVNILKGLQEDTRKQNEAFEVQLVELKETTIPKPEHEAQITMLTTKKQEIEKQLNAEKDSVKRLNTKLTEFDSQIKDAESQIKTLESEKAVQVVKIEGLQTRINDTREDAKMWKGLYEVARDKSWLRKLWETLTGESDDLAVADAKASDSTSPSEETQ